MKIQLEDGKAYVNGLGETVQVKQIKDTGDFQFQGVSGDPMLFMADGRYVPDQSPCSVLNLVAAA